MLLCKRQSLASYSALRSKQKGRSRRSRGLAALTSSLALKAHCAFNLKQAQRSELPSRATL
ncbi:hypothetical protein CGSMWGv00703Bmash_05492 [Gardnerella pickettii 00703Bmash]|nr:hypothetical protein CGSMWGv00703Bmash_05492 [Gardnerella pickettii 00703Bmash]